MKLKGYGLLEVIITLFILSVGLLSYVELFRIAFRTTQNVYFDSLAEMREKQQAEELLLHPQQ